MKNPQEISTSQPKTEEQVSKYLNLVEQLTKLIKENTGSGKKAWLAGKFLSEVKEQELYKPEFEKFEDFLAYKIGISKAEAQTRIKIYTWIKDEKLITKAMCISHLEPIIVLEDKKIIEILLKEMAEFEYFNKKSKSKYKAKYNGKVLTSLVNDWQQNKQQIINSNNIDCWDKLSNEQEKAIQEYFYENINFTIDDKNYIKEEDKTRKADIWGKQIQANYLKEIENFYLKEPIDEQGLVGLFCTIFGIIKSHNLSIKDPDDLKNLGIHQQNRELRFSKIKGIRQRFPDAIIEFDICDKKTNSESKTTELYIEFEFESYNYIRHEHYETPERCDLIICWKHDEQTRWERWKQLHKKESQLLPLILPIRNLLQEGTINLINLNKP